MNYQAQINISDAEDALEVAELLAALKDNPKIKVGVIMPRPEPRVTGTPQNSGAGSPRPPATRSPLPHEKP